MLACWKEIAKVVGHGMGSVDAFFRFRASNGYPKILETIPYFSFILLSDNRDSEPSSKPYFDGLKPVE